ncbi:Flp family type IVb pilin [Caldovatus aquaticus]|uniref:Flp family type IVb pilin n=1 Tax=Caldovatus aquaticus TaxID=2865671 RepID=A0ABS7F747_9PROT|nr:Flp family type IVb pilin [Caldovatus aquaticus]MBW8271138.1 Flp family type IVb pilin [Caldovatus aquaticus]
MTRSLWSRIAALRADTRGVAAMEYGLIAAFIAVAIIAGLTAVGGNLGNFFTSLSSKFVTGG